jgi:hypothetical protein
MKIGKNVLPIRCAMLLGLLGGLSALPGCATTAENVALAVGTTAVLGVTPNGGIEQTYYLGIFDPREQVKEPQFYRVRVTGQSSVLSRVTFASGWVRAELVDSLSTLATFNSTTGKLVWDDADAGHRSQLATGRHMILFGPEGFRPAPVDHRLVIVMGASPEKFFNAVDEALGKTALASQTTSANATDREILESLIIVRPQREQLTSIVAEANKALKGE